MACVTPCKLTRLEPSRFGICEMPTHLYLQQRQGISTGLASSVSSSRTATLARNWKATQTRCVRSEEAAVEQQLTCADHERPETTGNKRPETNDRKQTTGNKRPETNDRKRTTGNKRPETTGNKRPETSRSHALRDRRATHQADERVRHAFTRLRVYASQRNVANINLSFSQRGTSGTHTVCVVGAGLEGENTSMQGRQKEHNPTRRHRAVLSN